MPAFNAEQYLATAIDSMLGQVFQDWELIIVNDGSNDGTRAYLDNLQDPRIHVLHQPRLGVSAARNAALELAKGDIITFLDADDALPPDSLAVRVRYLDEYPNVDILDGKIAIKDAQLSKTLRIRLGGITGPYFLRLIRLDSSVFFSIAVMIRRAAIGKTRFRVGLTHCEDILFLLEASSGNNWQYSAVDSFVYCYRTGLVSSMSNLDGLEDGYFHLYESCQMLSDCKLEDREYLYRRIRRILILSWLRSARPLRAWLAWRGLSKLRSAG